LGTVFRVKLWNPAATIVWSDDAGLIGRKFDDDDAFHEAMGGTVAYELGETEEAENIDERDRGITLQIYTPLVDGGRTVGVLELYEANRDLFSEIAKNTRFVSFAVKGVAPEVMGIGPVEAIPAALKLAGLTLEDIGLFELNEAFAAQSLACVKELGLDPGKVNVNGGAIALGHPLGCTGAKLTASILHEMQRSGTRYGMVSMCIGGGMGAAGIFERV